MFEVFQENQRSILLNTIPSTDMHYFATNLKQHIIKFFFITILQLDTNISAIGFMIKLLYGRTKFHLNFFSSILIFFLMKISWGHQCWAISLAHGTYHIHCYKPIISRCPFRSTSVGMTINKSCPENGGHSRSWTCRMGQL